MAFSVYVHVPKIDDSPTYWEIRQKKIDKENEQCGKEWREFQEKYGYESSDYQSDGAQKEIMMLVDRQCKRINRMNCQ